MKQRFFIAGILLILLTTIGFKNINLTKFNLEKIIIENNSLVKENDLKKLLSPFYNKNLIFIKNNEIEKLLLKMILLKVSKLKKSTPTLSKLKYLKKNLLQFCLIKKKILSK